MKPLLLVLFFFTYSSEAGVLYLSPGGSYSAPRLFQDGQTSSFRGVGYGASAFYRFKMSFGEFDESSFSLGPVLSYDRGSFSNLANNSTQTEVLNEASFSAGIRMDLDIIHAFAQYVWSTIGLNSKGVTNLSLSSKSTGYRGGFGFHFNVFSDVEFDLTCIVQSISLDPQAGGFSTQTQNLRVGGVVSFSIPIQSGEESRSLIKAIR